jgi:hypothetical protein
MQQSQDGLLYTVIAPGAAPTRKDHARIPSSANAARDAVMPIQLRRDRGDASEPASVPPNTGSFSMSRIVFSFSSEMNAIAAIAHELV